MRLNLMGKYWERQKEKLMVSVKAKLMVKLMESARAKWREKQRDCAREILMGLWTQKREDNHLYMLKEFVHKHLSYNRQ